MRHGFFYLMWAIFWAMSIIHIACNGVLGFERETNINLMRLVILIHVILCFVYANHIAKPSKGSDYLFVLFTIPFAIAPGMVLVDTKNVALQCFLMACCYVVISLCFVFNKMFLRDEAKCRKCGKVYFVLKKYTQKKLNANGKVRRRRCPSCRKGPLEPMES